MIKTIAFDADDTLWECEKFFEDIRQEFLEIMSSYGSREEMLAKFHEFDERQVSTFGYGVKAFLLSMLHAANDISENKIRGEDFDKLLKLGDKLINMPIAVYEGVEETLSELQGKYNMIVITKGDLLDQNKKMDESGLRKYFREVVVVSEKNVNSYLKVFSDLNLNPKEVMMVGNSMKSDILPLIQIGAFAVHVPAPYNWQFEMVEETIESEKLIRVKGIKDVLMINELTDSLVTM